MSTARQALAEAAARFGFSATPRLDAELLLAHALGIPRERLLLTLADQPVPPAFADLVARRESQEPVAYLTGTRAFWTIDLAVGPGALVPRADSETLIEAAVDHFAGTPGPQRILDLGTGPGTLLLAALAEWPQATGLGIDASDAALGWAVRNARALQMEHRATFRTGDWAAGLGERFDLVLANPPYIRADADLPHEVAGFEPAGALFAGADGLDAYRVIATQLAPLLAPGGMAAVEIGFDQAAAVTALLEAAGLRVSLRRDLAGRDRCLVVQP
jgi:release factor glutamine methyltransferase